MSRHLNSVTRNVIWNGILSLFSILFPIITFPYVTRVLGVTTNGAVSFSLSVVNYFALFAALGLSTYGVKACAQVKDDKEHLSKVTHELLIISSVSAIVVLSVLFMALTFVPAFRNYRVLMSVYSINIVLNVLGMNWMYQGIEKFRYITTRSIIFKIISIFLMFVFVKNANDGIIYAAISVFAAGAGNILNAVYSHNYIKYKKYSGYEFKRHLKPIFILFATTLAVNVYSQLDTVMLGLFLGDYATGIYSVAVKIKTILLSLVSSFSVVMMSRMAFVGRKSENDILELLKKSYNLTIFTTIPISAYFVMLATESVVFLSGTSFVEANVPMKILMPTIVISSVSQIIGSQYSVSVGKEKNLMVAVIAGAIVNVIFNALLIPRISYNGAALGTIVAEATQCIIQVLLAREMVKQVFSVENLLKVSIGTIAAVISLMVLRFLVGFSSLFAALFFSAVAFFATYLVVLIFAKYDTCMDLLHIFFNKGFRKG